ncbi:response regulator [Sphaerotilus uruguayifluvii]|uniref:histidine kinase n=1 Tax=Sphaerotilus uruguayifluvii TaxID=2735897 RepID=A0ABX2FYI5_9BURK|nr:response regulator [Leptothrix sp. C29]NRT55037.1 PAS domain S-box-containing protein [Leptothrix sp. C29]
MKLLPDLTQLKTRLTLLIAVVCLFALVLQALGIAAYARLRLQGELAEDLGSITRIVADRSTAALQFGDRKVAAEMLGALKIKDSVQQAAILDAGGRLFATYRAGENGDSLPAVLQPGAPAEWQGPYLQITQPVMDDGLPIGTVLVRARFARVDGMWRSFLGFTLLIMLGVLGATLLLSRRLQRQILDPVEALTDTARRITTAQDYSLRAPPGGDDEVGNLARFFNGMLDVLQERNQALIDSNRRLSDNEAELRGVNAGLERRVHERTAELATQFALMRALLDTIPNPIFYKDTHSRFIGCNQAFEQTFGVRREQLSGQLADDLEPGIRDRLAPLRHEEAEVLAGAAHRVHQAAITFADGQVHDTLCSMTGFSNADGTSGGLIGVIVDISALKQAERDAQQARLQAEEASRMKSDFLATMSHEIRTPMNAIIGMLYLALGSELSPSQHGYLSKAQGAAHSLLAIINDILDISRIEAGRLELETTEFGLDTVLEQLKDTIGLQAEQKGIEFLIRYDVGIPQLLVGDPLRLGQVMLNLCSNAIKFTERGEVELAFRCVAASEREVTLQFSVRDTGIGIAPEIVERLFQKFTQADQSTTRRFGGTGLGLAISRQLAELMGGRLWIEDTLPGRGTTVCCTVRLGVARDAQVHGAQLTGPAVEPLRGLRVLVVDDNEVAREILAEMVRHFRIEVATAPNGPAALEMLRDGAAGRFDIVMMDWRMPQMNGDEVTRRILSNPAIAPKPKVVMVTAYGREDVLRAARLAGADAMLIKPVSPSMLLDTILTTLGRGRVLDAHRQQRVRRGYCDLRQARLLLVEDNDINREFATEILRSMNAEVDCAVNGAEAVVMVRKQAYAAVLMDIQMPVMDGIEATRRIRALGQRPDGLRRCLDMPIIAMTALAMSQDKVRSLQAGMNDHLTKPISPEQLQSVLTKWVLGGPEAGRAAAPGDPSDETLEDADLAALRHLDAAQAVRRIGGDAQAYRRQLQRFRQRHASGGAQLRQFVERGDLLHAQEHCHTLKGVCGNLGATSLFEHLGALDHDLRQGERPDVAALQRLDVLMHEVVEEIDRLDTAGGSTAPAPLAPSPVPPRRLRDCIDRLASLLQSDLGLALPVLEELRQLGGASGRAGQVGEIAARIDQFEIEEAVDLLGRLRQDLQDPA